MPGSGLGRKAVRTVSCQAWSEGPGHGASLPRGDSWDTEPPWQEGEGASLAWWSYSRCARPPTRPGTLCPHPAGIGTREGRCPVLGHTSALQTRSRTSDLRLVCSAA